MKSTDGLILVVDDESGIRTSVKAILQDEGYAVIESEDGEEALARVASEKLDAVLLDVWMPGMDGIETLKGIKQQDQDIPVIIMSGHGTIETAVRATKLGAYDFLEKPLSIDRLTLVLKNALSQRNLVEENRALRSTHDDASELVGESDVMKGILEQVSIVAPTQASILISGENGTGKELLARAIHKHSRRNHAPFIAVNCAAIPETLIESVLFGHEKGAFTGATSRKLGKFDLSNTGTLLLDEIGDMSLATQAKILRVLEEKSFERVGGTRSVEVDVRIIAATNKNLEEEIATGRFREDLFFRLNVFPFLLPPLRERRDDIPPLVENYVQEFGTQYSKPELRFSPKALRAMVSYFWPGNVRELKNVVERVAILAEGDTVDLELIPVSVREPKPGPKDSSTAKSIVDYRRAKRQFERDFFLDRLSDNDWNISRTSQQVGLERSNLHRKIKQLGLRDSEKGA
ncbi:MAG: sigma-54-dependent transcriptional regulator [bacterium]